MARIEREREIYTNNLPTIETKFQCPQCQFDNLLRLHQLAGVETIQVESIGESC
jgi:transcription elongation factor Elf1